MWFWRGTQSAIFYYVSLSPCLEYNHKRQRRKEANRSQKERAELELSQPGLIHQPVPFQTNQYWAEEIQAGPGPPRGWRKHSLDDGAKRVGGGRGKKKGKDPKRSVFAPVGRGVVLETSPLASSSSYTATQTVETRPARPAPRASTPGAGSKLDALKDTIKSTIARPDTWNWKRYEREDETLFGINDRISRMWDRATQHGRQASTDRGRPLTPGRRRADTADSDEHSWLYARNPGVNDLHPATVSQLPRTKREVAWMMQPAPSRAVMEGKVRPGTESGNRRPLCKIGGIPVHPRRLDTNQDGVKNDQPKTPYKKRRPDIVVNPCRTGYTEAEENDGDGYDEDDDASADEETEATSNPDYPSFRSSSQYAQPSSPSLSSSKSPPTPRQSSPLRRPPLAALIDSQTTTKIHSYHVSTPSPKLVDATAAFPASTPPRLPELDVWMGFVLPKLPERSRYSLPNVRLGEL